MPLKKKDTQDEGAIDSVADLRACLEPQETRQATVRKANVNHGRPYRLAYILMLRIFSFYYIILFTFNTFIFYSSSGTGHV